MLRRPTVKLITQTCHTLAQPEPIFLMLQKHSKFKSITLCKEIHANLLKSHANPQVHVSNTLLSFYSECGDLSSAHRLFDQMPHRNVVTWTSLISSCIRHGAPDEALSLFIEMLEANESPNPYTFTVLVRACTSGCLVELGRQVHGLIVKYGLANNEYTGSTLVDFYRKVVGNLSDAFCVFDRLSKRDLVIWNVMISGLAQTGDVKNVLRLFTEMREIDKLKPNDFTLTSLLKCCCFIKDVEQVHGLALRFGFDGDVVVGSALIDVYGKCGDLGSGKKIFDSMEVKDGYAWSSMVTGHIRTGSEKHAILLFKDMLSQGVKPDQHVLSSTLKACTEIGDLETGTQIHSQTIKNGYQNDCFVGSSLINFYADANERFEVEKLFRGMGNKDIVVWNTVIMCYSQMGEGAASLCISLLRELNQSTILAPDEATFVAVINSCKSATDLAMGVQVHCLVIKLRQSDETSIGNALVTMYSNCENIESARKAFTGIAQKDEVSWSSLIGIYHQSGFDLEALGIFKQMLADGIAPTCFSLPLVVTACAKIVAVDMGKQLHSLIRKLGFNRDVYVGSSVVDMYAKCGDMEDSEKAFEEQGEPNEVAFNSLISGFARDGNAHKAIQLFREMGSMEFVPNLITFLTILSACSHSGLVEESLFFFGLMNRRYNMKPRSEHYACLIDVLGRVGRLEEAYELVENGGCFFAWKTLLNACRNYENVKIAEKCARKVVEIDPNDHSPYIILSNMYSRKGKWEEASKLRQKMVHIGIKKNPGSSWLM